MQAGVDRRTAMIAILGPSYIRVKEFADKHNLLVLPLIGTSKVPVQAIAICGVNDARRLDSCELHGIVVLPGFKTNVVDADHIYAKALSRLRWI
jgi:hypothetical protein